MTDLHIQQDGVGIEHKYDAAEEKVVVRRYIANHDQLAEQAQRVRNDGGTKTINDARLVGKEHLNGRMQRPFLSFTKRQGCSQRRQAWHTRLITLYP